MDPGGRIVSKDVENREIARISIIDYFSDLPDPRVDRHKEHKLLDILVIAICAVIAGCEACTQMAEYGRRKESWLRRFLELPHGIPSHDTFSRVLALVDPGKFQECFMRWAAALHRATGGKVVAIDGKTLRRSFDRTVGLNPLHLVMLGPAKTISRWGKSRLTRNPTKSRQFQPCWSCWT